MPYESIARIERVSKSTQTEIFRFEKNPLQKKKPSNKSTGAPITPRAANHIPLTLEWPDVSASLHRTLRETLT